MSVVLREEYRLKVFENRVLSRICGPKCEEVMEEWRTRFKLYSAPRITRIKEIKEGEMGGARITHRLGKRCI
jgi:hypothetical protein